MSDTLSALNDQLEIHAKRLSALSTVSMFDQDTNRFENFSFELDNMFIDFSKNGIDKAALTNLVDLARARDVEGCRNKMFAGGIVNVTENRPALHVALRDPSGSPLTIDGMDIRADVSANLDRMESLVDALRSGSWLGATGKPITDIIHIGIGGSVLGPEIVVRALMPTQGARLRIHFVANVDASALMPVIAGLDPETTAMVIVSKTFTTQETMTNARSVTDWLLQTIDPSGLSRHMLAITSAPAAAEKFGVDPAHIMTFRDWVGGRYSLWSAVGFSIALVAGMEGFRGLLEGARKLDMHFLNAPLESNIPVLMALVGIWNTNFLDMPSHAVLPYDDRLAGLPAFLQQLEMESNGKSVQVDGSTVTRKTVPVIFGFPGTDAQHSFFQALHQGTRNVSMDFIGCLKSNNDKTNHHDQLMANLFAQTEALMVGRAKDNAGVDADVDAHRVCPGNRPTTTILLDALTPETLGMLLALYEQKTFVQSIIWGINAFDQWGVELGKQLGKAVLNDIETASTVTYHDGSTNGLINRYLKRRAE